VRRKLQAASKESLRTSYKLHAWDSAAGFLIVQEAGGKVSNLEGEPYSPYQPGIIATNGIIHDELQKVIAGGMVRDLL